MKSSSLSNIFLFIFFCIISVSMSYAQKIEIILLDSLTKAPIANASVFLADENNGTVSNEKGIAVIGETTSRTLRISHLNYNHKNIMVSGLAEGTNTILVRPKNPTELEEVVVNIDSDKLILGKWVLTGANALKINKRGKEERKSAKSVPANLKEYTADGSFHVSLNDKEIMKGNYTAFENQINESVVGADIKKLEGIKNILFYVISKDNKTLIVKYQLPKSEYVVEEIWKRL
ncbi:carboxypeptidase-like regulatory domain-containing protein [Sphingobacterium sp. N143]|uniref:carboxypeptidase-like regulatory domain-containing protein n=1 Tax=Sphingobacterium sp. N143 TaxID=2746727 RepID=UPI0025763BCA|nr:carboxypeptidase-like regulatory domain-containing protein [Sphingobacterium sp. N143]MDM1296557.1 carboxypeptidase-like regulatory domain-containing protein [Sphingobacterium sp. N143]